MSEGFPGRWIGLSVFGIALIGCYSLQPLRGVEPDPGSRVAFDLNDSGRVALGGTMGPQIAQVEGLLIEKDSTGFLLAVSNVKLISGGDQVWSGEPVRLDPRYLGPAYARRISWGRSIGLGAVTAGGIAAFVAGFSWVTGGNDPHSPPQDSVDTRVGRP